MQQLESAEAALQDARLNALVQVDRAAQTAWQEQKARAEKAEAALEDAREALRAHRPTALMLDRAVRAVRVKDDALATLRAELDLPEHLAEIVSDALAKDVGARAVLVEGAPRPLLTGKHPRDVGRSTWALDAENDGRNPGDAQGASGGEGS